MKLETIDDLRDAVVTAEAFLARRLGRITETHRKSSGDRMANEFLASVAALLLARAIGMIHVWTGEPIDSIRKRVIETMDDNVKTTVKKLVAHLGKSNQ